MSILNLMIGLAIGGAFMATLWIHGDIHSALEERHPDLADKIDSDGPFAFWVFMHDGSYKDLSDKRIERDVRRLKAIGYAIPLLVFAAVLGAA